MLRTVKVFLVLAVAIWGLVGAWGNLEEWSGIVDKVNATTSMSSFQDGERNWRATSNPVIVFLGAAMIPIAKLMFGVLCLAGGWRMWRARASGGLAFESAKKLALAGCGIAILMLFSGWNVIADTWFQGWRSETLRDTALTTAFRYAGYVGLIALFIAARDDIGET